MKDFIKWLGVNEKVAKVAVWILIIMVFLILTNTLLSSLGFPNYRITYENIKEIDVGTITNLLSRFIVCILNFYAILLLVFRIKETKKLFKWAILYLILNIVIYSIGGYIITQIFIIAFFILFTYFYSNKNKKYIFYGIISIVINVIVEAIAYYFKGSLIDIAAVNRLTRGLLFLDYFIIMAMIILVKEIYLKKRGESNGKSILDRRIQKRKPTSQKTS